MFCLLNVNVYAVELKVTKFKSCISEGRGSNKARSPFFTNKIALILHTLTMIINTFHICLGFFMFYILICRD